VALVPFQVTYDDLVTCACAAVHDFKECLDDLEQQVADFTDEVQQLAEYTTDSISFEVT
jgi:hypothetical protein